MPRFKYLTSFKDKENHIYDNYRNLGYNYKQHIFKNVLSQEIFGNPMNDNIFRQMEKLIEHLVDEVKQIKISYAFTYDKHAKNLN